MFIDNYNSIMNDLSIDVLTKEELQKKYIISRLLKIYKSYEEYLDIQFDNLINKNKDLSILRHVYKRINDE